MSKLLSFTASLFFISAISPAYCAEEKHSNAGTKPEATQPANEAPAHVPLNPSKKPLLEKVKENPTGYRDDIKQEATPNPGEKKAQDAAKRTHEVSPAGDGAHESRGSIRHPHHEILHKHVPAKAPRVNILEDLKSNPHKYDDRAVPLRPKFVTPKPSEDHQ